MATKYRISDGAKWKLITLAVIFDIIQLLTPGYTDTLITAVAFLVVAVIFVENGAFYMSQKGATGMALRIFVWLGWASEVDPGWLPMITVSVIAQIYISRAADRALGEKVGLANISRRHGTMREISKNTTFAKKRAGKMLKVVSHRYGKGRRGARTYARKASE